jgi:threonine dehydratase
MSLTLPDIRKASTRIKKYLKPTPLLRCEALEKELNFQGSIYLKCEQEQPTGSFKVRGAFNVLLQLTPEEKAKGVITHSRGNFAQAVAFAANKLHIDATIVMPRNVPKTKAEGTKKFGATVLFSGNRPEESELIVNQQVAEKNFVRLHPYNDYRTMAGQGTAALEILKQLPEVDHFFCPIGGGGLLSGCALAFKEKNPAIATYGVEPAGAGDYHASRKSGRHETWAYINTIADGLRAPSVGELNYPILNQYVDDSSIVTDLAIKQAMKWLYENLQMVTEPSGVVSLAGFIAKQNSLKGNVVILISGKNVDQDNFKTLITEAG